MANLLSTTVAMSEACLRLATRAVFPTLEGPKIIVLSMFLRPHLIPADDLEAVVDVVSIEQEDKGLNYIVGLPIVDRDVNLTVIFDFCPYSPRTTGSPDHFESQRRAHTESELGVIVKVLTD